MIFHVLSQIAKIIMLYITEYSTVLYDVLVARKKNESGYEGNIRILRQSQKTENLLHKNVNISPKKTVTRKNFFLTQTLKINLLQTKKSSGY